MARFIFKLEAVLTQRKHAEHERQRVLGEALRVQADCEAKLAAIDEQVQQTAADLRNNYLVGVLDVQYIVAHKRYVQGMQQQAIKLAEAIARARLATDAARAELATAARAKKAIEKLRETQLERWKADQAKREADDLDEAGMQIAFEHLTRERLAQQSARQSDHAEYRD